jgi:nitric oxide dioxygenase
MLVRTSFSLVVPIQDTVSSLFYGRLFAIAPNLRRLFSEDITDQKRKLMAVLSSCVGRLHDFPALAPVVRELGARHVGYGAKREHYASVAQALLWALEKGLGDLFTFEVRSAWIKVYDLLAAAMQAGAEEIETERAVS